MTTRIERLVQQLDDSTGPSYDARAELTGIGSAAIPALIALLDSDDPTTRERAATGLAEESRTWSLLEASKAPADDNVFVAPAWIDRTDLNPER